MENNKNYFKNNTSQSSKAHIFSFFTGEDFEKLFKIKNKSLKRNLMAFSTLLENNGDIEFHNKFTKSHLAVFPPKAVYSYFPRDDEIILPKTDNSPSVRYIFNGKLTLTASETESLDLLKFTINRSKNTSTNGLLDLPTSDLLRFLQATDFNLSKTLEILEAYFAFKTKYLPVYPTASVKQLINSGFMYVHGRDKAYRPILVVNPLVWLKFRSEYSFTQWIQAVTFYMEYIVGSHCLMPGQVEQWNVLVNLTDVNLTTLPKEFGDFMNVLTSNYRGRLFRLYLLNMSFMLRMLWKLVTAFLNKTHLSKVRILGEDKDELWLNISDDQIERKLGGRANDVLNYFFPPT